MEKEKTNQTPTLYDVLSNSNSQNIQISNYNEYLRWLTVKKGIPYYATLEISPVCNFDCEMCYVRMSEEEVRESGGHVMGFDEWKYYIDGLIALGTNNFSITGGECMLHPDFIKIYSYIYDQGKAVSLISNCSCLTDEILDTFVQRPPSRVTVTVYGSSREVYQRVCKNGAAYDKVIKNIDRLIEKRIPLSLQCTVVNGNEDDFENITAYANSKGLKLYYSHTLLQFNKCDYDKRINAQVDADKFKERIVKKKREDDRDYSNYVFPKFNNPVREKGLVCGAARNHVNVTWRGCMKGCSGIELGQIDPRQSGGVAQTWEQLREWGRNVPQLTECQRCIFAYECGRFCWAFHYNDTGEYNKISPRLCFKVQHPEEAAKLQAEYDRRMAQKDAAEQ